MLLNSKLHLFFFVQHHRKKKPGAQSNWLMWRLNSVLRRHLWRVERIQNRVSMQRDTETQSGRERERTVDQKNNTSYREWKKRRKTVRATSNCSKYMYTMYKSVHEQKRRSLEQEIWQLISIQCCTVFLQCWDDVDPYQKIAAISAVDHHFLFEIREISLISAVYCCIQLNKIVCNLRPEPRGFN